MAEAKKPAKAAKEDKVTKKPKTELPEEVQDGVNQEDNQAPIVANQEPEEVKTAKAGKRSEKAIKATEAKVAKEAKKTEKSDAESDAKPKVQQKPARTKLERKSKKFRKLAEQIEVGKTYNIKDALELAIKTSPVKFDATVELHARLGVDPRQADQNLRDTIVLPAGTGKAVRVAVLADSEEAAAAKKAGADIAGSDEFLAQLEKGVVDFDILISTPAMMGKLGKYARLLGPKGLMPNPKSGTVATNVAKAVTEAKAGRVEYRIDSTGIIHVGFGKVSFGPEKLLQNVQAILASIKTNRPASLKATYIKSLHITTSMGPSIIVDVSEAQ